MNADLRRQQRFQALDPARSVAVEACAGSGKTWLLTSRLLRLLLSGVRPGEILAITYTRKAAREIEARLRRLLGDLVRGEDGEVILALRDRGLVQTEAEAALPRARGLLEAVLRADPPITITTFHGWFARLLGGAPLDSGLAGRSLSEAAGSLLDEAWVLLAADCSRAPDGAVAKALLWLYGELGLHGTRKLLRRFIDRRAEWRIWCSDHGGTEGVLAYLEEAFGGGRELLEGLFAPQRLDELEAFARLMGQNTATDQALAMELTQAVLCLRASPQSAALSLSQMTSQAPLEGSSSLVKRRLGGVSDGRFAAVCAAFLTKEHSPRKRKSSKEQAKRLGTAGDERFLSLHAEWSERLVVALGALQDQRNAEFNRHALTVGEALLAKLDQLKLAQRAMDFADLEGEIDRLLAREGSAAYLQARLDARYRHILLDEFQDTNPLQWRILRGWLDAYATVGVARPSVFLVGDPKQSIYRFRRAEPKLFTAAAKFFGDTFGAVLQTNAHTFRNAPVVVSLVNELFAAEPLFMGFTPQTAEREGWPGRIEVLPLIPAPEAVEEKGTVEAMAMRLPLQEARVEAEDLRRKEEAALLVQRIGEMVGGSGTAILVRGRDGNERPARYADVLILTRRTTQLGAYEAALREAGIPFVGPGRGGLLDTLEAQDLLATLRFLADPADDLALAQVLRMPAFAVSDDLLLQLSAPPREVWWSRLQMLAGQGNDAAVIRAVRLLRGWLEASRHLPAHDLTDRMFHEAEWLERCRAVLPAALWPGVHANLEALLELSLNVDAGRYPSLTRFVDELRRLSGSEDEAPDEGLIAPGAEGMGRVRIMTIHGAKGLEAPIVWLIDAHSNPRPREGFDVLQDWPAEALAPRHFSLLGRLGEAGPLRLGMLEEDAAAAQREELNLLYVAITRAEQVLIVSGVQAARNQTAATAWSRVAAAVERLGAVEGVLGEMPYGTSIGTAGEREIVPSTILKPALRVGEQRHSSPANTGMDFGTALHAWLEAHTLGSALPEVAPAVVAAARRILAHPELVRFFDPAQYRRAGSEVGFVDADGKVGRIDRWVDCKDAIWVLDYKSGGLPEQALRAQYDAQVQSYCAAMRSVFPGREVRGLLVFADADPRLVG